MSYVILNVLKMLGNVYDSDVDSDADSDGKE